MSLSEIQVKKIAHLARLKITDDETHKYTDELNGILDWIEKLNEVDTDNVEPLRSVHGTKQPLRDDKITDGDLQDDITSSSEDSKYHYFTVPKVIE